MTAPADLFGFDPPELGPNDAVALAVEHWGVSGSPQRLRGERSHNTLITGSGGDAWTLQVQSASEDPAVIDLQTRAMRHLERRAPDVPVPRVVPTGTGAVHAEVEIAGRRHLARLVTFLPGTTFDPSVPLPAPAYHRIGGLIGRIAAALSDFEHPAAPDHVRVQAFGGDDDARDVAHEGFLRQHHAPAGALGSSRTLGFAIKS